VLLDRVIAHGMMGWTVLGPFIGTFVSDDPLWHTQAMAGIALHAKNTALDLLAQELRTLRRENEMLIKVATASGVSIQQQVSCLEMAVSASVTEQQ
jgi:hypothetical protein